MQRDGKCDDGSTLEEDQIFCDLGTDCHDCGNWTTQVPADEADGYSLPIDFLHSRQVCLSSPLCARQGCPLTCCTCKGNLFVGAVEQPDCITQGVGVLAVQYMKVFLAAG